MSALGVLVRSHLVSAFDGSVAAAPRQKYTMGYTVTDWAVLSSESSVRRY